MYPENLEARVTSLETQVRNLTVQVRATKADAAAARVLAGAADRDVEEILHRVYAEVPRAVWPAARRSIMAQLVLLRERGEYSGEESADYSGE
mgnify:CR=1 FL=1